MKTKHGLIIKEAISEWLRSNPKLNKIKMKPKPPIECLATRFNWEIFYAAKVEGDTLKFMARELYPYLTSEHITKALMAITGIDGSGICGSGVQRDSV